MRKAVFWIVLVLLLASMLASAFAIQPMKICEVFAGALSKSVNRYVYDIAVLGYSYNIVIETDGVVSGLSYTNFTFSLAWESFGTFVNITIPKSLNNTKIRVMHSWMIQGWDESPNISGNDTHYFITSPGSDESIDWVYFGEPKIEMDISALTVALGYYVNITGKVTYRGHPMDGMGVGIFWSSVGGGLPNLISTIITSHDGTFNVSWMPHATGTFYISAELACPWIYERTDEVPVPASHTCLSVSLPFEQYVFSVVSNSTISELTFNSTANTLSFLASGPDGTNGYARVFISKQLLTNIGDLTVYVDGNQTNYTYSSTDDSWVINITYRHSTHEVQMVIPEFPSTTMLTILMLTTLIATIPLKKKRKTKLQLP